MLKQKRLAGKTVVQEAIFYQKYLDNMHKYKTSQQVYGLGESGEKCEDFHAGDLPDKELAGESNNKKDDNKS